jgi:hypothetical protein
MGGQKKRSNEEAGGTKLQRGPIMKRLCTRLRMRSADANVGDTTSEENVNVLRGKKMTPSRRVVTEIRRPESPFVQKYKLPGKLKKQSMHKYNRIMEFSGPVLLR